MLNAPELSKSSFRNLFPNLRISSASTENWNALSQHLQQNSYYITVLMNFRLITTLTLIFQQRLHSFHSDTMRLNPTLFANEITYFQIFT